MIFDERIDAFMSMEEIFDRDDIWFSMCKWLSGQRVHVCFLVNTAKVTQMQASHLRWYSKLVKGNKIEQSHSKSSNESISWWQ